MSDIHALHSQDLPPATFVDRVKEALKHLYDLTYLHSYPPVLADAVPADPGETSGQLQRRTLIAEIEAVSPGPGVPFRAPHARPYNLLHLHYVEGMTMQEAANELRVSLRQAHRDLRSAEMSVAIALWSRRVNSSVQPALAADQSSMTGELARVQLRPRLVDLQVILQYARRAVEQLALQHQVHLRIEAPATPVLVAAEPAVAQQLLICIMSHAVQTAQPGALCVALGHDTAGVSLAVEFTRRRGAAAVPVVDPVAQHLAERVGWQVAQADQAAGVHRVRLHVPTRRSTVLVVDDNEGFIELLERYLTGHRCRLLGAACGADGLQLARELNADVIVLDVMMPDMDGWEVLQSLRVDARTAATPVIVCSVFNDPVLARSLGATLLLPKPVSCEAFLAALHHLKVLDA